MIRLRRGTALLPEVGILCPEKTVDICGKRPIMLHVVQFDGKQLLEPKCMEKALGLELRKISNLSYRFFEQCTNHRLLDEITGANGWIIGFIGRRNEEGHEVYQRDVEAKLGVTRSTASKVINLMVQKGLIVQKSVQGDKRLKSLILTPRGQEIKQLIDEDHRLFEDTLRQAVTAEELETLFTLLDRIKQQIEQSMNKEEMSK